MAKSFFNIINQSADSAVISIEGTIGGWDWDLWDRVNTGRIIRRQLKELGDVANIEVRICSLGGDVDEALQIHDALKDHSATVTTIINGFCASAATIIALAGDVRKISKNSVYLIHKCSSGVSGNEHDLQMELDSQKTVNDILYNMYKEVCKKSDAELTELFDADNGHGKWIKPEEAVDFGFCTEVYNESQPSAKVAMADAETLAKLNYPSLPDGTPVQVDDVVSEHEERLFRRIIDKARELFAPKTQVEPSIINQNQQAMKKFLAVFAYLGALLAIKDDQEYDDQAGHTLTNEELGKVEAELAAYAQLKHDHQTLTAERDKLKKDNETLTSERDSYKAKWESKPQDVTKVNGSDPVDDITDNAGYERLEKMI